MNKTNKQLNLVAMALIAGLYSAGAVAATDTGDASVVIAQPITITLPVAANFATIAAGILLTVAGFKYREKTSFFIGNICVVGGFLFYWEYAVRMYSNAPWISSIVLGLFVILFASYIENRDKQIMAKSRYYFKELKNWH